MDEINRPFQTRVRVPADLSGKAARGYKTAVRRFAKRCKEILQEDIEESYEDNNLVVFGEAKESFRYQTDWQTGDGGDFRTTATTTDMGAIVAERGSKPVSNPQRPTPPGEIYAWMQRKGMPGSFKDAVRIAAAISRRGLPRDGRPRRPASIGQRRANRKIQREWNIIFDKYARDFNEGRL